MIKTQDIQFTYSGSSQKMTFPDLYCAPQEKLLVLGNSGCGKTTLLHILGGILKPHTGSVSVKEQSLYALSDTGLDTFRGKNIGIIFQKSHFLKALTVRENLALAQNLAGQPQDVQRITEILDRLNLKHKLNAGSDQLSIGEQQRVAIARAIVNRPAVLLADEPTSALDDENTEQVIALLEEQAQKENAALVIVTHDVRLKNYVSNQIHLS